VILQLSIDRSPKVCVVEAGNTEAPALAALKSLGFIVTRIKGYTGEDPYFQAENEHCIVRSASFSALLGLAVLTTRRGENWYPTDKDVDECLEIIAASIV